DAETDGTNGTDLVLHAQLYALGDKYDIPSLKQKALLGFRSDIAKRWNILSLARATRDVFTTTPDSDRKLRDVTAETLYAHASDVADDPGIEAVIVNLDGLAYRLWKLKSRE
ncbi:hypothetical protein K431DRAFT_198664, partial [Polychaeton citri CBS 116435]